ncbi:MAG: hypothetical protein HOE97_08385 [Rhodospirillaceae bacterium]|jgi:hypothetical protein|nr:hypothetical protein [Rhodospirillaceae bacterium]
MSDDYIRWKKEKAERLKNPAAKREADIKKLVRSRRSIIHECQAFELKNPSPKQERALRALDEAIEDMNEAGWLVESNLIDAEQIFLAENSNLARAVIKAMNADLLDHPLVRNWITNLKIFGEWDELRRFKRKRLEKEVKRPPSKEDFWLRFEAQSLLDEGIGPQKIRQLLLRKLRLNKVPEWFDISSSDRQKLIKYIKDLTRQGFSQKLKRLGCRFT